MCGGNEGLVDSGSNMKGEFISCQNRTLLVEGVCGRLHHLV